MMHLRSKNRPAYATYFTTRWLIVSITFGLVTSLQAQNTLIGTGTLGEGSVFSINEDGTNPGKWADFLSGAEPIYTELLAYDGRMWGMTRLGGGSDQGVIFSIAIDGTNFIIEHHFDGTSGSNPDGSLVLHDGQLWGTTSSGGFSNQGVIFSFNATTGIFTNVYDFDGTNGSAPRGDLIVHDGQLWGMARDGGGGHGVIFSFNTTTDTYTEAHDFDFTNGRYPYGSLVVHDNQLWGMTAQGGLSGHGVIFSFNTTTDTYTKTYDFDFTNGAGPRGNLVVHNGQLWGMARNGGDGHGVIFSFNTTTDTYTKTYDFDETNGAGPYGSLVVNDGQLWGVTAEGGLSSQGVIFSFNPTTGIYTKAHDFDGVNGSTPHGSLIVHDGQLWGMTRTGGGNNRGVIFSYDVAVDTYNKAYDFFGTDASDGSNPHGSLIVYDGQLWGMARTGGGSNQGVIFSINLATSIYTKVHDFDGANGEGPYGSLVVHDGQLWGMTTVGGGSNQGVIFSFNPATGIYTNEHDFDGTNGSNPYGSLVVHNGQLWGMARNGGGGHGVIFSFNPATGIYTNEHDFDGTNGSNPYGSLVVHDGQLWGMTSFGGGSNQGVIFSFNPATGIYTNAYDFDGANGSAPRGDLIVHDGQLWGMNRVGGDSNQGAIFSFNVTTGICTKAHDFDGTNGGNPFGSLVESNGRLFGMTRNGGANNVGVIFSIDATDGLDFVKLYDLDNANIGGNPEYGSLLVVDITAPNITSLMTADFSENGTGTAYTITTDDATATFGLGTSKDEALFSLSNGNEVSFSASPDYENPQDTNTDNAYVLDVTATDEAGNSSTLEVTITVTDVDEVAPNITSSSTADFAENGTGTAYAITADDAMATFDLGISKDEALFAINGNEVSFVTAPDYEDPQDANSDNAYVLDVIASDGAGNSSTLEVTITVTDVDEVAPEITSSSTADFAENGTGTAYAITTNDATATFDLGTSKDEALFSLNNGNEVSFSSSPDYENPQDTNTDNAYVLDVIATDEAGNSSTLEVTITVTDVDEVAPEITSSSTADFAENGTGTAYAITVDDAMATFGLGTNKDEALFTLIGNEVSFATSPDYEDPQDANADNVYVLDVTATDEAGNSSTLEVTITVTDVDEVAPEITSSSTADFAENGTGTAYAITADDAMATFGLGTNKDEALFTLIGNEVSFATSPDYEDPQDANADNVYVLDVTATDEAGNSSTLEVTITVTDVDEVAPNITSSSTVDFAENGTGTAYTITTDDATAILSLGSSKDEALFALNGNEVSFTAAPDYEAPQDVNADNVYALDVTATDEAGNSSTLEVTITVTDVDDDPLGLESNASLTIYPNPARDSFTLRPERTGSYEKVILTDLAGKVVKTFNRNSGNTYKVVDLKTGVYVVFVLEKGSERSLGRLVIESNQ